MFHFQHLLHLHTMSRHCNTFHFTCWFYANIHKPEMNNFYLFRVCAKNWVTQITTQIQWSALILESISGQTTKFMLLNWTCSSIPKVLHRKELKEFAYKILQIIDLTGISNFSEAIYTRSQRKTGLFMRSGKWQVNDWGTGYRSVRLSTDKM